MFDELGMGDVLEQAPQQQPELRDRTVGEAVKGMGLNGLGFLNQALSRVPHFFQHHPTSRLMAPRVPPTQLNDDALGRALETLDDVGVTARYRLMAATAAQRLGLAPRLAPLARTSVPVDGRDNRAEAPEAHVMHSPRGDSRAHRPDRNHVMLALIVAHQAGIPVRMQPRRGKSRDAQDCGQLITDHLTQWPLTYGTTGLVAGRALARAETLQTLAATRTTWITRVPATVSEAQAGFAQAAPQRMAPLTEGYRDHVGRSRDGGVAPRWGLIHAEPRQPRAQRPVDTPRLQHREQAVQAFKPRCRTACACAAEAQQALAPVAQGLPAPFMAQSTIPSIPPDAKRGRPGQGPPLTQSWISSKAPWPCGSPLVRRWSTSPVVSSSRPLHSTPPAAPYRPCSPAIQARRMRRVGVASGKTRSVWPPRALAKHLNAAWRS